MNQHLLRAAYSLLLGVVCAGEAIAQEADVVAIRALQVRQADAWNRHDAADYSDLFAHDGDVVNVLGWWWQGRTEIRDKLVEAFAYVFKESTLTITDVHVRFLDSKTAVAHVRWTMEGAKAPPGAPNPPSTGIQVQILRKEDGRWRIASFQNTNSVPETPFPMGPPAAPAVEP